MEDSLFLPPTQKQHTKLVIQFNERLVDPKQRKNVLMAITGLHISSQKQLTRHYVSALIDEMEKNERSSDIIKEIENEVRRSEGATKGVSACRPWLIFSRAGQPPSMPNMRSADNGDRGNARSVDLEGDGAGTGTMENQRQA